MLSGIREELAYEIESLVKEFNMSYIDATISYCEKNGFDEEYIGSILAKNTALKSYIEIEAENLNFLQKKDRLPL